MSQLEVSAAGRESPAQLLSASSEDKTKEGEQDWRKPYAKNGSKPTDTMAALSSAPDGGLLHPITEEDEHGSASKITPRCKTKGQGPCYHSVPSDEEDSGDEETDATPLLREEPWAAEPDLGLLAKGKSFVSDIMLDKKSSDSGVRSSRSSSDHSLQDEESETAQEMEEKKEEEAHLIELVLESPVKKRVLPHRLGNLQDEAVARMSICSDALSDSSTPEETWPASAVSNLNCSTDNAALNNNINNSTQQEISGSTDCPTIIIRPGSSTDTTTLPNQNLRGVQRKSSTGPTTDAAEERESVL